MKRVFWSVLPMLLVVFAIPSPARADMTVYLGRATVEVPATIQLLMLGFALLGLGGLVRKWRRSRRGADLHQ